MPFDNGSVTVSFFHIPDELPEDMVEKDRHFVRLKHIPVKDSPLLLKFGEF